MKLFLGLLLVLLLMTPMWAQKKEKLPVVYLSGDQIAIVQNLQSQLTALAREEALVREKFNTFQLKCFIDLKLDSDKYQQVLIPQEDGKLAFMPIDEKKDK